MQRDTTRVYSVFGRLAETTPIRVCISPLGRLHLVDVRPEQAERLPPLDCGHVMSGKRLRDALAEFHERVLPLARKYKRLQGYVLSSNFLALTVWAGVHSVALWLPGLSRGRQVPNTNQIQSILVAQVGTRCTSGEYSGGGTGCGPPLPWQVVRVARQGALHGCLGGEADGLLMV